MSIQKADFPDGGFVLHRIPATNTGRVSAWYDREGRPLDAEQVDDRGRSRPVKKGGPAWQIVEQYGRRYVGRGIKSNPRKSAFQRAAERRTLKSGHIVALTDFLKRHPQGWHSIRRGAAQHAAALELERFGVIEIAKHAAPATWQVRKLAMDDPQAVARFRRAVGAKSNPRGIPRAGARLPSGTSQIWGRPIKTWKRDGFTLRLYDTNVPTGTGRLGETFLAYDFFDGQKLIFTGDRYRVAPGYAVDSMASVYGLLGFLSLKPGDTDDEYFKDYSPAQMAWVESGRAEDLGLLVALNEERAGRREYRRRIR